MNNNDIESFAINASNNKEFLLGGLLAKARIQSKEQKEEEDKEQVPLAHRTEECFTIQIGTYSS
jgi:hypothetical protein